MTRTITIDGDDHTGSVRLESLIVVNAAYAGEVGQGGFVRSDDSLDWVPAMKDATVEEDAATQSLMFDGFTGVRSLDRGKQARQENLREYDVTLLDLNTCLDDEVFQTDGANRPAETGYARVTWLLTTSAISALGIAAGVVPNTNTKLMDPRDYRGEGPRAVLQECAEAEGKNYFVYNYGSGRKLYYDLHTGTSLTTTTRLTTVLADIDDSTTWAFDATPKLELDPSRVYSTVRFTYASGVVWVTDTDIEDEYRRREIGITDTTVKSAAKATERAQAYLDSVRKESQRLVGSVTVPKANVNDIMAGQRLQVKVPHLETERLDLSEWTYLRILRAEKQAAQQGPGPSGLFYTITLEFADDLAPVRGGSGGAGVAETELTLERYQLEYEVGGTYGPDVLLGTEYDVIDPSFSFGTVAGAVDSIVSRTKEHNVPWEFTDCGIGTGAVGGLATREAWYRFQVDLADVHLTGVKVLIAPFKVFDDPVDYLDSPSGELVGDNTVNCGVHCSPNDDGSELSHDGQWNLVGRVGDQGGELFIPRSRLLDDDSGYCWFVLAPNWTIDPTGFICNDDPKPWGYGLTGNPSDDNSIVSIFAVTDSTFTAANSTNTDHDALSGLTEDDHTQYQLRSEQAVADGYPSLDSSALVPTNQLGTGSATSSTFLRGDGTWQTVTGGGGATGWSKIIDQDGSSFAGWSSIAGTWSSDGTWIKQTNTAASFQRAYFDTKLRFAPIVIQYDFRFDSGGSGDDYAGVSIGQTTATGAVAIRPEIVSGVSQLRVEHDDGNGQAALFTSAHGVPTWTRGTTYTIKASIFGDKVTVWVDGTLLGTVEATKGGVLYDHLRLLTHSCAADFKAIKVWSLDLP